MSEQATVCRPYEKSNDIGTRIMQICHSSLFFRIMKAMTFAAGLLLLVVLSQASVRRGPFWSNVNKVCAFIQTTNTLYMCVCVRACVSACVRACVCVR